MSEIEGLIQDLPEAICSPIRKEHYIKTLELRKDLILLPALERTTELLQEYSQQIENTTDDFDIGDNR